MFQFETGRKERYTSGYVFLIIYFLMLHTGHSAGNVNSNRLLDPEPNRISAIRFDPSYYYNAPGGTEKLCSDLVVKWSASGVNTVFYKVYDPLYGAKYRTEHPYNVEADYGRENLLKYMLRAAEKKNIRVFAWIPAFQHKRAWEKNPDWRVQLVPGTDYRPNAESYFLCPANPEVRSWWTGFIRELLEEYENLAGVDIAEPIVSWNGSTCFCEHCRASGSGTEGPAYHYSSKGLSRTLRESVKLVREYDKEICITTVASVKRDGTLLSNGEQIRMTGFDLETIISGEIRPDYLSVEFMWQQWAERFGDPALFTPAWTGYAVRKMMETVDRRVRIIAHLERTSFGDFDISNDQFLEAMRFARDKGLQDIDVYDSHLLDSTEAWDAYRSMAEYTPVKNVLVVYDPEGENDARQLTSLLSHFHADITPMHFERFENLSDSLLSAYDRLFVLGVTQSYPISRKTLEKIRDFKEEVCWINYGIEKLLGMEEPPDPGFRFREVLRDSGFNTVVFDEVRLEKIEPVFNMIEITEIHRNQVYAWVTDGENSYPYVIRSGRFWYVSDLPTAYVVEGGRHIVISDLLHDIMYEDHLPKKLAMVRIEDVHPLTDPESLRDLAGYFRSEDIPFSVSVVPYYLEPESNTTVSMYDRPLFVEALKDMQKAGGCIVMHGTTHQYRGETTADYEFWDMMADAPLFGDSREFVRQRLIMGLNEFARNGIFPVVWETPHYGASQLDYGIINTYFSSAYERRQTMDLHGSDQLLPYLIYNHTAGGKIIPENLGYVPLSNPDPKLITRSAEKNLLIRDGVASFFFHAFVDHDVLEDIVDDIKNMGYVFTSPKWTSNRVHFESFALATGRGEIGLSLEEEYYGEYLLDPENDIEKKSISDSALTMDISRKVSIEPGWTYLLRSLERKPENYFSGIFRNVVNRISLSPLRNFIETSELRLSEGRPISACIIYNEEATGVEARSQENLIRAFSSVGVSVKRISVRQFLEIPKNANVIFLPQAASEGMNEQQRLFLIKALQSGMNVVLEGMSRVSTDIGIYEREGIDLVRSVRDEYYPQVGMQWGKPDSVQRFDVDIEYVSFYSDAATEAPVIIGGEYGKGKYLYLATLFDPSTEGGIGRFPFFVDLLNRQFDLRPAVRRHQVEIYFEPGDREDISIEDLIKIWRSNGVRRIYVSAWHFYEDYAYEYQRLIELAHQNAMDVYAWLELPHVSQKFWNDHPEWREKTATGEDAIIGWRRNMALNIPECRSAVRDFLDSLLTACNWDGINLANLYFESPAGFSDPASFTPMNQSLRQTFADLHGYDPAALFDRASRHFWKKNKKSHDTFLLFRENQILDSHEYFLEFFFDLKRKHEKEWEIMVTTVDDTFGPEITTHIGINNDRLMNLARQLPFTVQLENPAAVWSVESEKYSRLIQSYRNNHGQVPVLFNINVIPETVYRTRHAPTHQPTGIELYQAVSNTGRGSTRVALYSEASIYEIDFPMLACALASETDAEFSADKWIIDTEKTVHVQLNGEVHKNVLIDGDVWPGYYKGRLIVPPGRHEIGGISQVTKLGDWLRSDTRVVDLSGELLSASSISRGIELKIRNQYPGRVLVSEKPMEVALNGHPFSITPVRGELGYSFRVPEGEYSLTIYTHARSSVFIKQASVFISFLIVVIGSAAVIVLLFIYLTNRIRRKFAKQNA